MHHNFSPLRSSSKSTLHIVWPWLWGIEFRVHRVHTSIVQNNTYSVRKAPKYECLCSQRKIQLIITFILHIKRWSWIKPVNLHIIMASFKILSTFHYSNKAFKVSYVASCSLFLASCFVSSIWSCFILSSSSTSFL